MKDFFKDFINHTLWITISILAGILFVSVSVNIADYAYGQLKESVFAKVKNDKSPANYAAANILAIPKKEAKDTSLLFVGDIMLSRNVEKSVMKNAGGDFSFLFKQVKPIIKKADIAFGNLEGPVSDTGKDVGNLYSFRMKPESLIAIKDAGFNALSIANNHINDWGKEAVDDTLFRLKNEDIIPVGGGYNENDALNLKIINKNGLKFGFLGFNDINPKQFEASKTKPGILIIGEDFNNTIKSASEKVDILVVSIHFGEEYRNKPSKRQQKLARAAIDNGAKIIIGHHPHVVQEIEKYKEGIIAYSLGNFIFDQDFSKETMEGLMLKIKISKDGEIKSINKIKTKLNEFFQLEI